MYLHLMSFIPELNGLAFDPAWSSMNEWLWGKKLRETKVDLRATSSFLKAALIKDSRLRLYMELECVF